nr:ATP-binding protein [Xanthomonas campestris]
MEIPWRMDGSGRPPHADLQTSPRVLEFGNFHDAGRRTIGSACAACHQASIASTHQECEDSNNLSRSADVILSAAKSVFVPRWLEMRWNKHPIDRRQIAFLQVLLIAIALYNLGDVGFFLYVAGPNRLHARPDLACALVGTVLTALGALASVPLIRSGRSAIGVKVFITAALIGTFVTYVRVDVYDLITNPMPVIALVLAGMVLGRDGLWRVFAMLAAVCLLALAVQVVWFPPPRSTWGNVGLGVVTVAVYLLITLVLDRTIAALRDSLVQSERRRCELEAVNRKLLREMAERERVQEQLLHTQKMEALGRLASGVAHDFDNLINVIIGFAQRRDALEGYGEAPLLKTLENIEAASRRALTVSRRILNFGRAEPGIARLFDARNALLEMEPTLRQLFGHEVRLHSIAPGPPLWIAMDLDELELALLNIAANARDAMDGPGVFRIDGDQHDGMVMLALSDTGPGIPEALLGRILEPFYTTKSPGKGTGLGLSVVNEIVIAAGGRVEVGNTQGGACIRLLLPAAAAPLRSDQLASR